MLPTLAAVAAALEKESHHERRAVLDELALALLRLGIGRWELAQLRRLLCRLSLDEHPAGGDDDQRDAAA